jgi:hypothetical protein
MRESLSENFIDFQMHIQSDFYAFCLYPLSLKDALEF